MKYHRFSLMFVFILSFPSSVLATDFLDIGGSNTVVGYGIIVGGENNYVYASDGSIVAGVLNQNVMSYNCSVFGEDNYIFNNATSLVAGSQNTATAGEEGGEPADLGCDNMIMGHDNSIGSSVNNTLLFGKYNSSNYSDSYVFGEGNIGQSETVTLGRYAATVPDASFIVGRGTSDLSRANGLIVLKNGNVQIPGTLTVSGSSLSVAGSPVMTNASASAVLGSQGFITASTLSNSIKNYCGKHELRDQWR